MQLSFKRHRGFSRTRMSILVSGLFLSASALAQQAATTDVGRITVEGTNPGSGLIQQEETPKARSSVTRAQLDKQPSSNNPYQAINLLPGVNQYSFDATGLFGGGLRMRGFNSDQLGFTIDGAPVNDSGSFSVFPQEYTDSENLCEIFVTQGSTDTDAPHVGATGGNVGLVTCDPSDERRFRVQPNFGSNNLRKTYLRADTGLFLDGRAKAFLSVSQASADKFKGSGGAHRSHVDFKGVFNLSPGNSLSAGLIFNDAVNNNFRALTKTQINTFGTTLDFSATPPTHLTAVAGTAQTETNPADGYYNFNINPFRNYIATFKGNFQLTNALRLDVEPYFWYGFGTGGNQLGLLKESTSTTTLGGGIRDINGDGDTLDTVQVYRSSVTQTYRPGGTIKLSFNMDNHHLVAGYWYERARHRQTAPAVRIDNAGNAANQWLSNPVDWIRRQDGTPVEGRDWLTLSTGHSLFLQDSIGLMQDRLNLVVGARNTSIDRDFRNYANEGSTSATGANTTGGADYQVNATYSKVLPSLGARYQLTQEHQLFANIAGNFKAPGNFIYGNLLSGGTYVGGALTGSTQRQPNVTAETSTNIDLGYRYAGKETTFSGSVYNIDFKNRIARAYDPVAGSSVDYNVGDSTTRGFELEAGWRPFKAWTFYGSVSYTDSKIKDDLRTGAATFESTSGKQFPDTPKVMTGLSVQYSDGPWTAGLSAKFIGQRYSTLVNDESTDGYTVVDMNVTYQMPSTLFFKNPRIRLNVFNLGNANYLSLNSGSGSTFTTRALGAGGSAPTYYVSAPRSVAVMFGSDF
jgi:iron complex outermembrane receptor protein